MTYEQVLKYNNAKTLNDLIKVRIELMKELSTESLLNIRANLAHDRPDIESTGIGEWKMDDLYDDVDFELVIRGIK